jgi:hypothetical protein
VPITSPAASAGPTVHSGAKPPASASAMPAITAVKKFTELVST